MTATAADALALLAPSTPEQWPAGISAAADVRQARAKLAAAGHRTPWRRDGRMLIAADAVGDVRCGVLAEACGAEVAEHIAAEANPDHVRLAVRRWRGTVERHRRGPDEWSTADGAWSPEKSCLHCIDDEWPCLDLQEVADEARAYIGGAP